MLAIKSKFLCIYIYRVLAELSKRFKSFLNGDSSALHTNVLGTAFKSVLKNSSDPITDFDTILNFYKTCTSVDQKLSALASLGTVQNTEILHQLFGIILDSEVVKPQDIIYPLGPMGQVGALKGQKLDMLWNWIIQNWVELHKRYKASLSLLGRVLQSAIGPRIGFDFIETVESWARGDDLGTAEEKATRQDQLKTARRPLDQSIESVKTYTNWVSRERDAIAQWIKSNL
jgi:aminopeptidase 2